MIRIVFFALIAILAASFIYYLIGRVGRVNWHRSTPYAFLFLPVGLVAYYLDYQQTALIASVAGLAFLVYGYLAEDADSPEEDSNRSE
ncbi:MAG: hypothetical protein AAF362_19995 [Pseudomonadota bacterium]